jgi:VCBS repeat-containing protein
MKNLALAITATADLVVPAGTVVDQIYAVIDTVPPSAPQVQTIPPTGTSFSFSNLADGDYSYSVQAHDTNSQPLGTPVTGTFTVTDSATITIQVPSAVSVTLS